jgi:GDPmannose 4,6-dehydratase
MKKALITGITGMDGSHLAELLLDRGYEVHGIIRRSSSFNTGRIDHIFHKLKLHHGDVTDALCVTKIISEVMPDEIYNLAAQSHVQVSFEMPQYTGQVDAIGTLNVLEAVKNICPKCKIYNATTSELYGLVQEIPQKETTPFYPRSPYGVAKLYSFWIAKNYREAYGMFICNGILFNHSGPRRGETFVERKITMALSKISKGKQSTLRLGNLYSKRDIGYSVDYVEGMYLMLQQDNPDDFVLATGEMHSIKEIVEHASTYVDMELEWKGEGIHEKGYDKKTGNLIVEIDEKYFRPAEVDMLIGNNAKAKKILGWEPKIKFKELIGIMMEHDLKTL